jgi:hypothetical protein
VSAFGCILAKIALKSKLSGVELGDPLKPPHEQLEQVRNWMNLGKKDADCRTTIKNHH